MGSMLNPRDCDYVIWAFKTHVIDYLEDEHEEFEFLGNGLRVTRPFTMATPIKYTHGKQH